MADKNLLPKRPENDNFPMIDQRDKDCLSYVVAFAVPNQRAYGYFHPEFCDSNGKLTDLGRKQSAQFFSYAKHKEYCDSYRATLQKFLSGDKEKSETHLIAIDDKRKDNARIALYNKVIKLIEGDDDLDPDTLKIAVDMAKKLSIVADDAEEQVIKPLRFLPERCFSGCRYRLFVETAVKGGAVIDECQYCKALAYATENGYKDDATKRLDIPKEVLDAEPENTVNTLDILSGKVEN